MKGIANPVKCKLNLCAPNTVLTSSAVERLALLIVLSQGCPWAFQKRPPTEKQPGDMVALACVAAQVLGCDVVALGDVLSFLAKLIKERLLDGRG